MLTMATSAAIGIWISSACWSFTVHKLNEASFPVTVDYGSAVPFRIWKAAESVNA